MKVSLSSVDTTGTRALTCSKDRVMYIVLGKTTQACLEKVTQCKLVGNIVLNTFTSQDWLENFRMHKDTFMDLCNQLKLALWR